jgi:hypothetical protein
VGNGPPLDLTPRIDARPVRQTEAERINTSEGRAGDNVEVAVIGGRQAGLPMGYCLRQQRCQFVTVERGDSIAPTWHEGWVFVPGRPGRLPAFAARSALLKTSVEPLLPSSD